MAGRPRLIRCIRAYVNNIDNNTFSGPMKMGLPPRVGVTRNYWTNYYTQCNQNPNSVKKSYANMVHLNINSSQTCVSSGFRKARNNYSSFFGPNISSSFHRIVLG